jgi:hypothetical protein
VIVTFVAVPAAPGTLKTYVSVAPIVSRLPAPAIVVPSIADVPLVFVVTCNGRFASGPVYVVDAGSAMRNNVMLYMPVAAIESDVVPYPTEIV